MVLLPEERRLEGIVAPGGQPSWTDLVRDAQKSQWYVENINARAQAIEEAYDRRSDEVFKATGVRLPNPWRAPAPGEMTDRVTGKSLGMRGLADQPTFDDVPGSEPRPDAYKAFDAELKKLADQRPDLVGVLKPDRSPLEDARALAARTEHDMQERAERYRGPWGTGAAAQFAGGFLGMFNDPVNTMSLAVGPTGRAGQGLKGLTWMAAKQAAANAGVEALSQPVVASWRKEAGLEYSFANFAANVGGAAAFGFGVDFGVRGAWRAYRGARGHVPIVDEAGGVMGYEPPDAALERAAQKTKSDTLRGALEGDPKALRKIAEESGATRDPVVRSTLDMLDDVEATSTRRRGVDPHLDDEAVTQAMRHLADPAEPPPAPLEAGPMVLYRADREGSRYTTRFEIAAAEAGDAGITRLEVPNERAATLKRGEADGTFQVPADLDMQRRPYAPETAALRQQLVDGELDALAAARAMRENSQVLDAGVAFSTQAMRDAHALSRLSDAAFERVMRGEAPPELAAQVGRLVPDKARHASILDALQRAEPQTPGEARRIIGLLAEDGERGMPSDRGISDPGGVDGRRQIEALEKALGLDEDGNGRWRLDGLREPEAVRAALDAVPEASLARTLSDLKDLEAALDVLEHCKV